MVINSLLFLSAVFIFLIVYFILQRTKYQKYWVFIADLFFLYCFSGTTGLPAVLFLVVVIYFLAILVEKQHELKNSRYAKLFFWLGAGTDIAVLLYFKYFIFTWDVISQYLNLERSLIVPAGFAYYSLSLLGYLIDVYHKKYKSEKNFIDLCSFALFFPALVEGPFGFYKKLSPQLKESHIFDWDRFVSGLQRMLWGYFKKIVIADRIGIIVMGILKDDESAGLLIFVAMILYSFQIYADFSGGIDVIMGISEVMGITLHENFKSPLISQSVTEYWQRWHMSLGEWMEKVIYYPIVLNRKVMKISKKINNKFLSKTFSATLASFIVFIIVGMWHGTGWNYVVYGLYQAVFVSSAILLKPTYEMMNQKLNINTEHISWKIFRIVRTFVVLVFGRYLIKAANLSQAFLLLKKTFSVWNPGIVLGRLTKDYGLNPKEFLMMIMLIVLLYIVDILHNRGIHFRQELMKQNIIVRYIIYMLVLFTIIILGIYGKGYSATSFIYTNF